ncbi:MAG: fibronectin type III domain-containing protein, partial [Anaerolineae bacterium]
AAPPAQGACGEPIAASSDTRMTLTGLTAGAEYTLRVEAHDGSCSPLAASAPVTMAPRTVSLTFLPITTR